jgi:hypothetical protein
MSSRRCDGRIWIPGHVRGSRWIRCSNYASWLIPEVAYCSHHLPAELIPVAGDRLMLWADKAAELWRDVCDELPLPDHFVDIGQ